MPINFVSQEKKNTLFAAIGFHTLSLSVCLMLIVLLLSHWQWYLNGFFGNSDKSFISLHQLTTQYCPFSNKKYTKTKLTIESKKIHNENRMLPSETTQPKCPDSRALCTLILQNKLVFEYIFYGCCYGWEKQNLQRNWRGLDSTFLDGMA